MPAAGAGAPLADLADFAAFAAFAAFAVFAVCATRGSFTALAIARVVDATAMREKATKLRSKLFAQMDWLLRFFNRLYRDGGATFRAVRRRARPNRQRIWEVLRCCSVDGASDGAGPATAPFGVLFFIAISGAG